MDLVTSLTWFIAFDWNGQQAAGFYSPPLSYFATSTLYLNFQFDLDFLYNCFPKPLSVKEEERGGRDVCVISL